MKEQPEASEAGESKQEGGEESLIGEWGGRLLPEKIKSNDVERTTPDGEQRQMQSPGGSSSSDVAREQLIVAARTATTMDVQATGATTQGKMTDSATIERKHQFMQHPGRTSPSDVVWEQSIVAASIGMTSTKFDMRHPINEW